MTAVAEARIDTFERPLEKRGARALPFGGGCALALGLGFIAFAGVLAVAVGAAFAVGGDRLKEQRWLIPPALLFIGLLGAGLVRVGVRDKRRAKRSKEMAALHPDEPWFADWTWDRAGTLAEAELGGGALLVILFVLLIMAPFNVLWVSVLDSHQDRDLRLLSLMVLIPDFFMYLVGKGLVSIARDRLRHGRAALRFEAFPFLLGETLRVRVTARRFAGQEGVAATLRCIDERMVQTRDAQGTSDSVRAFQVYEGRQILPGRFAGRNVTLDFPLPHGPSTGLLRQPPLYWELELAGSKPDDTVTFLVPVYAPPAP